MLDIQRSVQPVPKASPRETNVQIAVDVRRMFLDVGGAIEEGRGLTASSTDSYIGKPAPPPAHTKFQMYTTKIYTLLDALTQITELTGRPWTRHELFERLHAHAFQILSTTPPHSRVIIRALGENHDAGLPPHGPPTGVTARTAH
jgi:hypothetical protein